MAALLIAASPSGDRRAPATDLLKAEDALFRADTTRDVAAIERGFADEALFVHANGKAETKRDYLEATRTRAVPVRDVAASNRVVRVFGDVGVIRGTKSLVVGDLHLSGSYLSVYVKRAGRWQLLDQQSSPAPAGSGSK